MLLGWKIEETRAVKREDSGKQKASSRGIKKYKRGTFGVNGGPVYERTEKTSAIRREISNRRTIKSLLKHLTCPWLPAVQGPPDGRHVAHRCGRPSSPCPPLPSRGPRAKQRWQVLTEFHLKGFYRSRTLPLPSCSPDGLINTQLTKYREK